MNRIIVSLLLIVLSGSLLAKPRTNKRSAKNSTLELGRQIASHIDYPAVMREGNHEGIVVITFGVSENNRLSRLTVHTDNRQLNDDITRQLVNRKIRLSDNNPFETYTVRLHFAK